MKRRKSGKEGAVISLRAHMKRRTRVRRMFQCHALKMGENEEKG